MFETLAPILKPGVTDVLLSSTGTFTHRQHGRWVVNPSPATVKELLTGIMADLAAHLPDLQRALVEARGFEFTHVVPIGSTHRVRVMGSAQTSSGEKSIELSMRVHPVKSPLKASETSEFVKAIAERRSGLFLVSGGFGRTTLIHAIAQHFVRAHDRRSAIVQRLAELDFEAGRVPVHHASGAFGDELAGRVKGIGAEVVFVFDGASDAATKHRLAVLGSHMVVVAAAPGGNSGSALLNWAEESGVSTAQLSNVFAGVISISLQGDGQRFRQKFEKYFCAADDADSSVFRSNLAARNWKVVTRALAPPVAEGRRDVA